MNILSSSETNINIIPDTLYMMDEMDGVRDSRKEENEKREKSGGMREMFSKNLVMKFYYI